MLIPFISPALVAEDHVRQAEYVYRNKALQVLASVVILASIGLGLAIVLDRTAPRYLGGIVATANSYLVWMLGWQSSVRMRADGVVVDNMFLRACVPWISFREFRIANGLKIVMTDGRAVGAFAFGGSVIGQATGYRSMRKVLERMEAERRTLRAAQGQQGAETGGEAGGYRVRVHIVAWPALAVFIPLELLGLLTALTR